MLELGAERRVLNRVDLPVEAAPLAARHHAGTTRAEVRVIVDAKEHVECNVAMRDRAKERSHEYLPVCGAAPAQPASCQLSQYIVRHAPTRNARRTCVK